MSAEAIAAGITIICGIFALGMATILLGLILRRRHMERAAIVRSADELAASRYLLAALAKRDLPGERPSDPEAERAAMLHLLRLVRGDDREALLAIAERDQLFAEALAGLGSGRAARRIDAMRQLELYASPACIAGLEHLLVTDQDFDVRLEAAGALARLGHLPAVDLLIDALNLLQEPATRLHAALFRALAKRDAARLLVLASSATYLPLRPLLVEALGWSEHLSIADSLDRHALDADPEVRCAAVRAARHLGHPAAGRWLVPLLDDEAEPVRVQAAQACGELLVRDAVPALERLATDPAWWVRTRARAALERLQPGRRASLALVGGDA